MTNDTTTLNGSLRQLGETMASNLTTQGVPSTYDEGLSTLAQKILDIQGGGVRTLTLTSDKDILSYADSESATLTATLLEDGVGVSGETVEFFNGSTSLGTAQTDSNGVAVKTYTSTGVGDIQVYAKVRTLVSKTYGIEDTSYYNPNTITGNQVLSIPNIPINFKASFKTQYNGSDRVSWLNIGENANNHIFFGQIGSTALGMFKKINETNSIISSQNVLTSTKEYLIEFTYENGVLTLKADDTTLTGNYTYDNRSFVSTNIGANNHMKELKIKPL